MVSVRVNVFFTVIIALISLLTAFVGFPAPLGSYGHDSFFFLDNAYRVLRGQVPFADFSSAFGPLIYQIHASGLALSGLSPDGIGYANALWGLSITIWTFLIVRSRFSFPAPGVIGIYTLCLIVAPYSLGNNPLDFGFAMTYNRYGYAILGIILLECGSLLFKQDSSHQESGGASTGVALAMLAFLKITYFLFGIIFVVFSFILTHKEIIIGRMLKVAFSFVIVSLIFLIYLNFSLQEMLEDFTNAAVSRRVTLNIFTPINYIDLAINSLILIFPLFIFQTNKLSNVKIHTSILTSIFVILSISTGYLTLVTNNQAGSFPLNGYAIIVLIELFFRWRTTSRIKIPAGLSDNFPAYVFIIVGIFPLCLSSIFSLMVATKERAYNNYNPDLTIESTRGDRMVFKTVEIDTETTGSAYVSAIKDGLALLERNLHKNEGVIVMDEFNPFNYLLGRVSPRGGISAAAYAYTFLDKAHPSAERFFGNTEYVVIRKYQKSLDQWEKTDVDALVRIYGMNLYSDFKLVEETEHWALWHKGNVESPISRLKFD